MLLTYQMEIQAPIEVVFSFLEDNEKQKLWMQGLEGTEYLTPYQKNNPVGVKFKQRLKEGNRIQEYEGEVMEYIKDKRLGVHLNHSLFFININYRLEATKNNDCTIYLTEEIVAKTLASKVMMLLFRAFMKQSLKKQMSNLKYTAEKSIH